MAKAPPISAIGSSPIIHAPSSEHPRRSAATRNKLGSGFARPSVAEILTASTRSATTVALNLARCAWALGLLVTMAILHPVDRAKPSEFESRCRAEERG